MWIGGGSNRGKPEGTYPSLRTSRCSKSIPMAYGVWCAIRRCSSATRLCGAFGTGYVLLGGLIGSRPVPST
eukprot:6570177-Prymnesium_polylepis.1